jgi:hypothetical protein
LLYLLTEDDPEIVVYGAKILARLLVSHGAAYTTKFSSKSGGFTIMAYRLKRWWDIATIWPICFSILFGYDVAGIDFDRNFDFFSLIETFGGCKVIYPEALPIITSMLQHGLKEVLRHAEDPDSPSDNRDTHPTTNETGASPTRPRARSMSLLQELEKRRESALSALFVQSNTFGRKLTTQSRDHSGQRLSLANNSTLFVGHLFKIARFPRFRSAVGLREIAPCFHLPSHCEHRCLHS